MSIWRLSIDPLAIFYSDHLRPLCCHFTPKRMKGRQPKPHRRLQCETVLKSKRCLFSTVHPNKSGEIWRILIFQMFKAFAKHSLQPLHASRDFRGTFGVVDGFEPEAVEIKLSSSGQRMTSIARHITTVQFGASSPAELVLSNACPSPRDRFQTGLWMTSPATKLTAKFYFRTQRGSPDDPEDQLPRPPVDPACSQAAGRVSWKKCHVRLVHWHADEETVWNSSQKPRQ